ncbi:MAG: adenine deaminase [Deltaproteobacteria bacterium]|nr:adenine deaminase [Deltaproteobacteria bacterium]
MGKQTPQFNNGFEISGNIVDVINRRIFPGTIFIKNQIISQINPHPGTFKTFIMPGFVDAHVHIESSMLSPCEFGRVSLLHGTVASVSDPHEIANVLGLKGIRFMRESASKTPFSICLGAPPCVPATSHETSGATISLSDIEELFRSQTTAYLAEVMNWPGVLARDSDVMGKIAIAKRYNKPIDGHAPGLSGEMARAYVEAGITTDHECSNLEEALEKISYGMNILIREGSAAKNFSSLIELLRYHPKSIMFCSDDLHPNDLLRSHINGLVKRAVGMGFDIFDVLSAACVNPVKHYGLPVGLLQPRDRADFIEVNNLVDFHILQTFIAGKCVAKNASSLLEHVSEETITCMNCKTVSPEDIEVPLEREHIRVIQVIPGELLTEEFIIGAKATNGRVTSDVERDILKLVVINRYRQAPVARAFVRGFNLSSGALSSTVAHDSHNIIAVGVSDEEIVRAVNAIIETAGGIAVASEDSVHVLPLPNAGLMSNAAASCVAAQYEFLDRKSKDLGSRLPAPFMTLSFLALLVIPQLKLSDQGLFDGRAFKYTELFV